MPAGLLVCLLAVSSLGEGRVASSDTADLRRAVESRLNWEEAKNVILFIGDGMGPNTVTAARIYRAGEGSLLAWEAFPHLAALKTYSADKQVTESASSATAMFTGVKNNFEMLGLDERVRVNDCKKSMEEEYRLTSLISLAQDAGKGTGIVTTTRITDATPAAMYAWAANRSWECDSSLPEDASPCKDIARQLIEDLPGKYLNVILGGGDQVLRAEVDSTPDNPIDAYSCRRADGRDLVREWSEEKAMKRLKHAVVNDTKSLLDLDPSNIDYLFGIFSNSHLMYDYKRDTSEHGMPSLEEMTLTAIKLLAKYSNGFFLLVEGGLIDKGHHAGKARVALHEVLRLNDAVNATVRLLERLGLAEETLVVVTSDHSHTLSISGYPDLGNSILGIADNSVVDGMPYTTLSYATSGVENFHFFAEGGRVVRKDPSTVDTTSFEYHAVAPVVTEMTTHGGNDVFVYATGPHAHLFHSLHENTYIATAIKYAAKLGEFEKDKSMFSLSSSFRQSEIVLFSFILYLTFF